MGQNTYACVTSFLSLAGLIALVAPSMVLAADAAHGAQIFSANCAACHIGGGNVVNGQRTLQQDDLKAYLANYNDGHEEAIAYQVTNVKKACLPSEASLAQMTLLMLPLTWNPNRSTAGPEPSMLQI